MDAERDPVQAQAPGRARAVLLAWTDIPPDEEADFNEWYNREHMRDRVLALPGFIRGRRFVAEKGSPKYLALYEVEDGGVFSSEEYVSLVSQPDPRSHHFILRFRNPIRTISRVTASVGEAEGAALAVIAFAPAETGRERVLESIGRELLPELTARPGVIAAHVIERDEAALSASSGRHVRQGDRRLDCALLIEASGAAEAAAAAAQAMRAEPFRDVRWEPLSEPAVLRLVYRVSPSGPASHRPRRPRHDEA